MAYIDSNSSTIVATLTRRGKELLALNSAKFKITKFAFGDDEIQYADYVGDSPDSDNSIILSTPILEPGSEDLSGLRWGLVTFPKGTVNVADIVTSPLNVFIPFDIENTGRFSFIVKTLRGYDSGYYVTNTNSNENVTISPTKDFFDSTSDESKFDLFQNQSTATISLVVETRNNATINNISVTIKGNSTGVSKTFVFKKFAPPIFPSNSNQTIEST